MIAYNSYHKKKAFSKSIVIFLLLVLLTFAAVKNVFGVQSIFQAVIYPFQYVAVSLWKGFVGLPVSVANLRNLTERNEQLLKEIGELKAKVLVLNEQAKENGRLQQALAFRSKSQFSSRILAAQVIGRSPSPWFSMLEINQGQRAGIKKDMPVINEEGLVGRVVKVSPFSATVILLKDVECSVAAANSRSRDFGVVEGGDPYRLSMKYVSAGRDIKEGDKIVTSNISAYYPAGIPIGTVVKASKREHDLFYHIEIKPAVDFSRLEEVFVIL